MARCNNCSAPLPADINLCQYCSTRNDVDLHSKHPYDIAPELSDRLCPHCEKALETVKLDVNGVFYLERCETCFGLFFDPGEIETFLQSSVSNVFDINLKLIKNINKDRYQKHQTVKYLKCPVCQEFMRRVSFGHRSGVIIDKCKRHGIWLDNGEITHLMEWKKAGGEMLQAKKREQRGVRKKTAQSKTSIDLPSYGRRSKNQEVDLLDDVASVIFKLFT